MKNIYGFCSLCILRLQFYGEILHLMEVYEEDEMLPQSVMHPLKSDLSLPINHTEQALFFVLVNSR